MSTILPKSTSGKPLPNCIRSDLINNPEKLYDNQKKYKAKTEGHAPIREQDDENEENNEDFDLFALLNESPRNIRNNGLNKKYMSSRNNAGSTRY